jgi:MFS transporter, CP family, cyanate transporter
MNDPAAAAVRPATPHLFTALALLWLAGAAIRIPLLVVPTVIPLLHDDLHMTETQVGVLMGLPLVMFAIAAVPGSLLIARLGVILVAITGLAATALASAARAAAIDIWTLYAATVAMGFGIAIMQPALPTLVRAWAPIHMWLASATYTNGMLVGATLASALSIPLVLPLVGGSWRADLLAWSAPGFAAVLLYAAAALRWRSAGPASGPANKATSLRWWPDWKSPRLWLLGITLGVNNAQFFAANAFVPDYLHSVGRGDLVGQALGWMNGAQLVASFILLGMAENLQRRSWPFTIFGPLTVLGVLGILLCEGIWIVLSAIVLGFGGGDVRRHLRLARHPQPARRRPSHGERHVHHQLHHRGYYADPVRRVVGRHRTSMDFVRSDRALRRGIDDLRHHADCTSTQLKEMVMAWFYLLFAGLFEVAWAIGLKYTEGFSRLVPSLLTIVAMLLSLALLGFALKTLPVGTAYAVWTGIGAVGTAALGIYLFGEPATAARLASIGLIVAGIVGLKIVT